MARYKYSENEIEVSDVYFDTETHGEYMGFEQDGQMKRIPSPLLREEIVGNAEDRLDIVEAEKENLANKVSSFQPVPDDTHYPSEKLVKDNLDTKIPIASIVNDLTTGGTTVPLSAEQGKTLETTKASIGTTPSFNGIKFPATQVPSSDTNTLDDYEEGTWTPVLTRGITPSGHTYVKQQGKYIKIGSKVTIWFNIETSAKTAEGSGQNRITGLPFAPASGMNYYVSGNVGYCSLVSTLGGMVAVPHATHLHFIANETTVAALGVNWNDSGYFNGVIEYTV